MCIAIPPPRIGLGLLVGGFGVYFTHQALRSGLFTQGEASEHGMNEPTFVLRVAPKMCAEPEESGMHQLLGVVLVSNIAVLLAHGACKKRDEIDQKLQFEMYKPLFC